MGGFLRRTYVLAREEAREEARGWFTRFPKAAYMTAVESWREIEDGRIEFTMRRLPTADEVGRKGYRAMQRGKAICITELVDRLAVFGLRFFPRSWVTAISARVTAPRKK